MQQRSIALAIILTLVTCGLYGIYWFIVLTNEVGRLNRDPDFTGLKHFLLTIVTCGIWSFIWAYQIGKQISAAQYYRNCPQTDNSVLYMVLTFFGLAIIVHALVQTDANKLIEIDNRATFM
ncbi:DUF4234 domain-containing protein [Paenibacillus alvei]|uniref:DUF4234 domain-containing protein n=1 Tax=Paenibacillus alvei TaxID=44250 RepID=UPI002282A2C1|nr:DUF4234 domain-containing protein [Paenibacillus alvei]MCY7487485.1 DUF4234 domain-containing protein [Paenibacillus alvei]